MEEFGTNIDLDAIELAYNQLLVNGKQLKNSENLNAVSKEKVVLWKNASLSFYDGVEKMIIPFFLKKRIFRKNMAGSRESFEGMSFFIVSKNEGKYEFEIMTRLSDEKYQKSMDAYAHFSGLIIVEDIFGDFIKGFIVEDGKISVVVKKAESKIIDDCIKIEWNLFSDTREMTLSQGLSHTDYYYPDYTILPRIQDDTYIQIGSISRLGRQVRYLYPELKQRFQLITGYPPSD